MEIDYPEDLKYLDTHEYVRFDGEIATIGVSSFAIDQLGDVVFLELPEIGDCLLYTSPSPRDLSTSRMPSSA